MATALRSNACSLKDTSLSVGSKLPPTKIQNPQNVSGQGSKSSVISPDSHNNERKNQGKADLGSSYIESPEYIKNQLSIFSELRKKIEILRKFSRFKKLSLPSKIDEDNWYSICFSSRLEPGLTLMLSLNQVQIERLLLLQLKWLQSRVQPNQGKWIYALLACIDVPLKPKICGVLRDIVSVYNRKKSQNNGEKNSDMQLDVTISVITKYFNQVGKIQTLTLETIFPTFSSESAVSASKKPTTAEKNSTSGKKKKSRRERKKITPNSQSSEAPSNAPKKASKTNVSSKTINGNETLVSKATVPVSSVSSNIGSTSTKGNKTDHTQNCKEHSQSSENTTSDIISKNGVSNSAKSTLKTSFSSVKNGSTNPESLKSKTLFETSVSDKPTSHDQKKEKQPKLPLFNVPVNTTNINNTSIKSGKPSTSNSSTSPNVTMPKTTTKNNAKDLSEDIKSTDGKKKQCQTAIKPFLAPNSNNGQREQKTSPSSSLTPKESQIAATVSTISASSTSTVTSQYSSKTSNVTSPTVPASKSGVLEPTVSASKESTNTEKNSTSEKKKKKSRRERKKITPNSQNSEAASNTPKEISDTKVLSNNIDSDGTLVSSATVPVSSVSSNIGSTSTNGKKTDCTQNGVVEKKSNEISSHNNANTSNDATQTNAVIVSSEDVNCEIGSEIQSQSKALDTQTAEAALKTKKKKSKKKVSINDSICGNKASQPNQNNGEIKHHLPPTGTHLPNQTQNKTSNPQNGESVLNKTIPSSNTNINSNARTRSGLTSEVPVSESLNCGTKSMAGTQGKIQNSQSRQLVSTFSREESGKNFSNGSNIDTDLACQSSDTTPIFSRDVNCGTHTVIKAQKRNCQTTESASEKSKANFPNNNNICATEATESVQNTAVPISFSGINCGPNSKPESRSDTAKTQSNESAAHTSKKKSKATSFAINIHNSVAAVSNQGDETVLISSGDVNCGICPVIPAQNRISNYTKHTTESASGKSKGNFSSNKNTSIKEATQPIQNTTVPVSSNDINFSPNFKPESQNDTAKTQSSESDVHTSKKKPKPNFSAENNNAEALSDEKGLGSSSGVNSIIGSDRHTQNKIPSTQIGDATSKISNKRFEAITSTNNCGSETSQTIQTIEGSTSSEGMNISSSLNTPSETSLCSNESVSNVSDQISKPDLSTNNKKDGDLTAKFNQMISVFARSINSFCCGAQSQTSVTQNSETPLNVSSKKSKKNYLVVITIVIMKFLYQIKPV